MDRSGRLQPRGSPMELGNRIDFAELPWRKIQLRIRRFFERCTLVLSLAHEIERSPGRDFVFEGSRSRPSIRRRFLRSEKLHPGKVDSSGWRVCGRAWG